jgi:penicillin-binding protein-related factor A (putative recombinase)
MLTDKDRTGSFRACYDGSGPPDYVGLVGARGVVFDAKEVTKGLRLPLSRVEPHQARDLEAAHLQGAHAFLAVRFREKDRNVVFDWSIVGGLYWDQAPSIQADDGIPMGGDGWLGIFSST